MTESLRIPVISPQAKAGRVFQLNVEGPSVAKGNIISFIKHDCNPSITSWSKLNKRNRLRRRGKIEAANKIAWKINDIIVSIRSKRLTNAAHGSAKDLWAQVRNRSKTRNKPILIGGNVVIM